jgi:2-polyprenyl-6-methoxyphenol hydroxylase-like FAD-dependent oxidoreductase
VKILVVGAGLSGMVLATALRRPGVDVELLELHDRWNVLGVGISVQAPALRALRTIGLIDACIAGGFGYSQVVNCAAATSAAGSSSRTPGSSANGRKRPMCRGQTRRRSSRPR